MNRAFAGIYPILVTPFHDDAGIDLEGQVRLVDHLLEQGVHGLGAFGNAGEGYALLPNERRRLLDAIVKRVDGRVPVIVGVGATGTDAAVDACRIAEEQGASGLMVLPPYYMRPDADGLLHFYKAISETVQVPIMVQDAPLMSQVNMPPALLARIARDSERVEYVKAEAPPTAPKVERILNAAGADLTVFGGLNGQFLIEEHGRGARGTMPASDMASLYVTIWDALETGQIARAWETFRRALPLIRFELQPGLGVSAVKHSLLAEGVIRSARVRHPTRELDEQGVSELHALRDLVWPA